MISRGERYKQTLDKKSVANEVVYCTAVDLIDNYISSIANDPDRLMRIKNDFMTKQHLTFNPVAGKTLFFGAVLYCRLLLDELSPYFSGDSLEHITNLSLTLKALYLEPQVNTKQKIEDVVQYTQNFFQLPFDAKANKEPLQNIGISFFANIQIMNLALQELNFVERSLLNSLIDIPAFLTKVPKLLEAIDTKVRALDAIVSQLEPSPAKEDSIILPEEEAPAPNDIEQIQEYLNRRSQTILYKKKPLSLKINSLITQLGKTERSIDSLIALENKNKIIESEILEINSLLEALNQTKVSFFAFTIGNQAYFNLLNNSEGDLKKNLIANAAFGFYPSMGTLFRQNQLALIQKNNSCKGHLQTLASERLQILKSQLNTNHNEANALIGNLLGDNSDLKKSLSSLSIGKLLILKQTTEASKTVLQEVEFLTQNLEHNQEQLTQLINLEGELADFIRTHDGWCVQFSLYLAEHIHSFFKSDTAKMILEASEIRTTLVAVKEQYEANITDTLSSIAQNPNISSEMSTVLHALIKPISRTHSNKTSSKAREQLRGFQDQYSFFKSDVDRATESIAQPPNKPSSQEL